ncbi:ribosome silencing factor [Rhodoferax sp.]|jgi:ribosome-associated protein|uniref:ribosome silencing factor n=1 Tax=Rhodoferax sp. TaxID=50421 RepID=UPI0025D41BA7|nr:ribosome silencing factor [Rhodoferax sp.]
MTTSTVAKNTQKLQRAVIDGLEDVKAQDIVVFDTEHLSALFERVIIASGTSNRQTKALAASVRDAVREAGFAKPRTEGEGNGEWIIVDCNQVVVHIMQPNFRQYYHLEELWGEKPVRLKLGAAKPVVAKAAEEAKPAAKKAAAKAVEPSMRRSSAAKKGVEEAFPSKAALKKAADKAAGVKAPAKKTAAKSAAKPASKTAAKAPVKTVVVKPEVKKTVAKKAAVKTVAAKKAPAKKAAPRKA